MRVWSLWIDGWRDDFINGIAWGFFVMNEMFIERCLYIACVDGRVESSANEALAKHPPTIGDGSQARYCASFCPCESPDIRISCMPNIYGQILFQSEISRHRTVRSSRISRAEHDGIITRASSSGPTATANPFSNNRFIQLT